MKLLHLLKIFLVFLALMFINFEIQAQSENVNISNFTVNPTSNLRCFPRLQWDMIYNNITRVEIERAVKNTAAASWVKIDNINLTTYNSSTPVGFSYIDENPFSTGASNNSTFYYRVKVIAVTNQFWYSSIISINNLNPNFSCTYGSGRCMNASLSGAAGLFVCGSPQQFTINNLPFQSSPVTWATSNNNIATVSSSGVVTPVSSGTVTISASLPICNVTLTKTIDVCTCDVPISLGANSAGSAYALYFNRVGSIIDYRLEWTNLSTNVSGSQDIVYSGATYTFTGVPAGTSFRYRVAAISACGLGAFSNWYYYGTSGSCTLTAPTNLSVACACGGSCAGSCGYERFSWTLVPNAVSYNGSYNVFNIVTGAIGTPGSFSTTTVPANQPIANYTSYTGSGWVINFQVTPVCAGGALGSSTTSGQFAL